MPDRRTLQVGDRIRLLRVPEPDLAQRAREIAAGVDQPGWTAETIERILAEDPRVTISDIDEYGHAWFEWTPRQALFDGEVHRLTIMEDDSWEYV